MGGGAIGCEEGWKMSQKEGGREALGGKGFLLLQNEPLGGQRDVCYDNRKEHLCG